MVGLSLLLLAAGALSWKTSVVLEKKRFQTDLNMLRVQWDTLHRLAINTESDWVGILRKNGKKWVFESACIEEERAALSSLNLSHFTLFIDGKNQDEFQINFYSSSEIKPTGTLLFFRNQEEKQEWKLPEIFQKEEGDGIKQLGPIHPNDVGS